MMVPHVGRLEGHPEPQPRSSQKDPKGSLVGESGNPTQNGLNSGGPPFEQLQGGGPLTKRKGLNSG